MLPIVALLAERGLSMLGNAILAKGKEKVEQIIGTKIPDTAAGLTPEMTAKLKELEMQHEERLLELEIEQRKNELEAEIKAGEAVTDRWKADMSSDSWLSKNIRPLTLIFILAVYTVFATASAFAIQVNQAYVELLGQWGMLIMSAYFVGRTVEKGISVVNGKKDNG